YDDFRKLDDELQQIRIQLNNAKFEETACQLKKGAIKPKQSCDELILELNRLRNELPFRKQLEDNALDRYRKSLGGRPATPVEQVEELRILAQIATLEREEVEQAIKDQLDAIAADPACKGLPTEQPEIGP